jgi:hypothetical protein
MATSLRTLKVVEIKKPTDIFQAPSGKKKFVGKEVVLTLEPADSTEAGLVQDAAIDVDYRILGAKKLLKGALLFVSEASDKYGISRRRLQTLCRSGRLVCAKERRRWMLSEKSLRQYLQTR